MRHRPRPCKARTFWWAFRSLGSCRTKLAENALRNQLLVHAEARAATEQGLHMLKSEGAGSSTFAPRALLLEEPPSIDVGEITDKGYIYQQRAGHIGLIRKFPHSK